MNKDKLFRDEVYKTKNRGLGQVLVKQPFSYTAISILSLIIIVVLVSFLCFGSYTKKTTAIGLLMPEKGLLRLTSNSEGLVNKLNVNEGDKVNKGDVILHLSGDKVSVEGGGRELVTSNFLERERILNTSKKLYREKRDYSIKMANDRLALLNRERNKVKEELTLLDRKIKAKNDNLDSYDKLESKGLLSSSDLNNFKGEYLTILGEKKRFEREIDRIDGEIVELISIVKESEIQYKINTAEVNNQLEGINRERINNSIISEQLVLAPISGTVTGISVQVGQQLSVGNILASLLPKGEELLAHVYLSPSQVGFIEEGQQARLHYAAYPYQKFGSASGYVINITKTPYALQELPLHVASVLTRKKENDVFYKVTLKIDSQYISAYGRKYELKSGMLVEVDIVQDNRKLYEWIFEPLYSLSGRFG
jgi:membrane fusion protein